MRRLAFLAILAAFAAHGASVSTAKYGILGLNDNVVTNVDLSGISMSEEDPYFSQFTQQGGTMYGPLRLWNGIGSYDMSTVISSNGVSFWKFMPASGGGGVWMSSSFGWGDLLTSESDPNVPAWAKSSTKPSYSWSEITGKPSGLDSAVPSSRKVNNKALSADITLSASDVGAPSIGMFNASSNLAATADGKATTAIAYLQGDDAKVVITNYDSAVTMPSMSLQQRIDEGGSNYWKIVWNEMTRWNWLFDYYLPTNYFNKAQINSLLDEKADRAWGYYDSHGGNYAPDGYTWVSSPKIAIAAGLAYQRTVTSEGAIWVLTSNGLVTETGGNMTNGFFRISDDEGNSLFEIVKGNKRTVGAQAGSLTTTSVLGITHMHITYPVVSESLPTVKLCTNLSTADWKAETAGDCVANVEWTGSSGAWVAEVWGKTSQPTMFVNAEYEVGGETYIKNVAPISADGGILCTDGIHKVRPVYNNGTITWEVVQ